MGQHKVIDINQEVPTADSTENLLLRDVVGNKTDSAAAPSSDTSVIAVIKQIYNDIATLNEGTELFSKSFPNNVEVDDTGSFSLELYDISGTVPTSSDITAGNYTIDRLRDGASTNIVASTGCSKSDGRIYLTEDFTNAVGWDEGDIALVTISGASVTVSGTTTNLPTARFYTRIVRGENIETGVNTLTSRLTAARAGYLDELESTNIPSDIDTLLTRLSAARAGYLDNLSAGAVALASVCTEGRLSELDAANLPSDIDDLLARLTSARAGYLDELSSANIPADVDTLLSRLTSVRAGYLDNLNGHTAQSGDSYSRLGAPAGASVSADIAAIEAYVDDLESRLTATRAGYLDNLQIESTSGNHEVHTYDDTAETTVTHVTNSGSYGISVYLDVSTLETAGEGGTITVKLHNRIDGTSYRVIGKSEYVVGTDTIMPSIEANRVKDDCKVTIQCSTNVTTTRNVPFTLIESNIA